MQPSPEKEKQVVHYEEKSYTAPGSLFFPDYGNRPMKGYPFLETEILAIESFHAHVATWTTYASIATGAAVGFLWDICTSGVFVIPSVFLFSVAVLASMALWIRVRDEKKSRKSYLELIRGETTFRKQALDTQDSPPQSGGK